jgi:hypothetical protein
MISSELGVSKSTLSGWLRNTSRSSRTIEQRSYEARTRTAQTKRLHHRHKLTAMHEASAQDIRDRFADGMTERELFLAGLMLYWAEGAKTQIVSLTNSDPALIALFVVWLERCLAVERQFLRAHVHVYPDTDVEPVEEYWADIIGISHHQFYKAQIDIRTDKSVEKRGRLPYGTVHLAVTGPGSTQLHRTVLG